ncbi:tripartite tricarboxylate transporter substrate binding protein [Zhihengliuella sp.]|uniref:tripartite tricarboxylate transporter substrate binding protein n=1 Tax=Zhihengliuella sp. TaxID=1954483 RepID=UPI0028127A0F|nr:tripartite tricarboxylate transporter substrate binding protein [Zhihengliuella sp.]
MHAKKTLLLTSVAILGTATLAACSSTGGDAGAEAAGDYSPGERITMTVPFSAGGGSDLAGRATASGLEDVTGTTITVENRDGGSGAVGYSHFMGLEGDPTQLLATETALMALPLVQDVKFDYNTFTPIMKMGDDYTLVTVAPDSPFETCTDVVEAARDGRVVAAVSGTTSLDSIVFSLIEDDQDIEFDRVPYESGSEVLAGLMGGHVDVASLNPGEIAGQLESGDLKALCALAPERYEYELLADIPTGQEQGIDVAFAQFRGYIAPGGIDDEAKEYWVEAGREFADSEAFTEYIEANYMQAAPLYGDEFTAYLDEYNENLKKGLGIE